MKKAMLCLVLVALLATMAVPVMAATNNNNVEFVIGLNKYFVNDQLPGVDMDVAPFIQDSRTFVPVRYLANALGVTDDNIKWDSVARQVYLKLGTATVTLVIGQAQIVTNGQTKAIDVAPVIKDDRTFLPARYVAEALGFTVDWDANNKIVVCYPSNTTKPDISNVVGQAQQSGTYNFNGYVISKSSQMTFSDSDTDPRALGPGVDIQVVLHMDTIGVTEPIGQQASELQAILAQRLDQDAVQAVMNYINQKISSGNVGYSLFKFFKSDGKTIAVRSGDGDIYVGVGNF